MNQYKYSTSELYNATNGGLDIIQKYFPQAKGAEKNNSQKFKFRANEKTPSATLFKKNNKWLIIDFGDKSYDAVSAIMETNGISFIELLKKLYTEFNVNTSKSVYSSANIDFKENTENLPQNHFNIVLKNYENLASIGRFLTPEIAELYNFFEIEKYQRITKSNKLMTTSSNEVYPIFCYSNNIKQWAKTYQPAEFKREKDGKTVNFKHGYLGTKDNDYIHGLDRILNDTNESIINDLFEQLKEVKSKEEKEEILAEIKRLQVKNVFLVSGGSDGLNLASIDDDFYPIWLNSEGAMLTYEQYVRINKLCNNFFNLPDVDNSGIKYAHKVSNTFWNIRTIWLPKEKLGANGKDFRDWLKYYANANLNAINRQFKNLMNVALKCNFIDYNEKGRPQINLANFHYFLNANNFYNYKQNLNVSEKSNEDTSIVVAIDKYKVHVPETSEIRSFTINYLKNKGVGLNEINLIKRSRAFSVNELKNIENIELDFKNFDADTQYFYFNNGIVKINDTDISLSTRPIENKKVWKHKIVNKNIEIKKDLFTYYKDEAGNNRVKINSFDCDFMCYLINASRIYWRKEIEESFSNVKDQEAYRAANLFTLNGNSLTQEEQLTQEAHFLSKCYAIGYLLHRYKREDFAKFIYIMDDAVKESDDDANGGTGKSLCIRALKELVNVFNIDGKDNNLTNNNHLLGGLQKEHDIINIEDGNKGLAFDFFYNKITGDLDVNPKNKQGYTIPYAESAKFVGTFNYGLSKQRGSDV